MKDSEFETKMDRLRSRYGAKKMQGKAWQDILDSYYDPLNRFDDDLVTIAIEKAWDHHRVWFPTLGELLTIVEAEKRHFASRHDDGGPEKPWADPRAGEHIKRILDDLNEKMTMGTKR